MKNEKINSLEAIRRVKLKLQKFKILAFTEVHSGEHCGLWASGSYISTKPVGIQLQIRGCVCIHVLVFLFLHENTRIFIRSASLSWRNEKNIKSFQLKKVPYLEVQ